MRHAKPNERRYCIELYKAGMLLKLISHLSGRPPQTIARWLRESGTPRRRFN